MGSDGVVYVLTNPSFRDGIVKIGMTTRTAEDRAWEIYVGATGVPEQFKIAFAEHCSNCALGESRVHEALRSRRVNERREFFNLPLEEAISTVRSEVARVNAASPSQPDRTFSNRVKIVQAVKDDTAALSEAGRGPGSQHDSTYGGASVDSSLRSTDAYEMSTPAPQYAPLPRGVPWRAIFLVPLGLFWGWLALAQLSKGSFTLFGLFCGAVAVGLFAAAFVDD